MRLLTLVSAVMGPTCVALGQKSPPDEDPRLDATDCQIRCPQSSNSQKIVLPALSQKVDASGLAENTLECWQIDSLSTSIPGIDNAFRLDWEDGFDAAYQYIFTGPSFMPSHPAPEPSLIVMSSGIGTSSLSERKLKSIVRPSILCRLTYWPIRRPSSSLWQMSACWCW